MTMTGPKTLHAPPETWQATAEGIACHKALRDAIAAVLTALEPLTGMGHAGECACHVTGFRQWLLAEDDRVKRQLDRLTGMYSRRAM